MAPKQKTFTVVPDAFGMQGLMSRPAAPSTKPVMTSKQAQKLYRESTKGPRLSKVEQRRIELEEQARIRKELDRDKQANKARAARDKKKAKEEKVKEEKRKNRQPLVDVHPSQDTISRFLRRDSTNGKKRDSDAISLGTVPEEDEDKGNQPAEKRQCVKADTSQSALKQTKAEVLPERLPTSIRVLDSEERLQGVKPSPKPLSETSRPAVPPPAKPASAKPTPVASSSVKSPPENLPPTSPPPTSQLLLSLFPAGPARGSSLKVQPSINPPQVKPSPASRQLAGLAGSMSPSILRAEPSLETFRAARSLSAKPSPRSAIVQCKVPPLASSSLGGLPGPKAPLASGSPSGKYQADKQKPVQFPAARPLAVVGPAEKRTASVMSPARFSTPKTAAAGPVFKPPRPPVSRSPIPGPVFKTPGQGTAGSGLQRPKFLPKHLQSSVKPVARAPAVTPPTSTQIFLSRYIDDILPSPSQEARELQEPISKAPTVPKFLPKRAPVTQGRPSVSQPKFLAQKAAHVFPTGLKPPTAPDLTSIPFISTQDLCISTQDVLDIENSTETPTRVKKASIVEPESAKVPPTKAADARGMGPPAMKKLVRGPPNLGRPSPTVANDKRGNHVNQARQAPSSLAALVNSTRTGGEGPRYDVAPTQETDYGDFDIEDYLNMIKDR